MRCRGGLGVTLGVTLGPPRASAGNYPWSQEHSKKQAGWEGEPSSVCEREASGALGVRSSEHAHTLGAFPPETRFLCSMAGGGGGEVAEPRAHTSYHK